MNCNFVLLHRLSSYPASYLLFLVHSSSGWKELSRKASLEPRSSVFGMGGLFLFFLPSVSLLIVTFFRFCCSAFLTRFRSFLCSLCSLSEWHASHPKFKYQFHHSNNLLKILFKQIIFPFSKKSFDIFCNFQEHQQVEK